MQYDGVSERVHYALQNIDMTTIIVLFRTLERSAEAEVANDVEIGIFESLGDIHQRLVVLGSLFGQLLHQKIRQP